MSSNIRVRFAPSPTGPLHIGGIRTALYNYLFAKKHNGIFILRIEDTDHKRYVKNSELHIINTLKWCNIEPDEGAGYGGPYYPYYQSKRKNIYKFYINQLINQGDAYYAFDTDCELQNQRIKCKKEGITFSYNYKSRKYLNNSLNMSKLQLEEKLCLNYPYVIRYKICPGIKLKLYDIVYGNLEINTNYLDDKILMKSNGIPSYHLANTVDDYLMKITHVLRGQEWISSVFFHLLIYRSMKWNIPTFAHLPLILQDFKNKISKRNKNLIKFPIYPIKWKDECTNKYILGYKELGYLSESFVNTLALLGWNPGNNREFFSFQELKRIFSIEKINKSNVIFDVQKSVWINRQHIRCNKDKVFSFIDKELNKRNLLFKKKYVLRVIDLTIERFNLLNKEIWKHIFYFFISPTNYIINFKINDKDINQLKKVINYLLYQNQFNHTLLKHNLLKVIINNTSIIKLLRISLVGSLNGIDVFIILEMLGKKESINRIKNFIYEQKKNYN